MMDDLIIVGYSLSTIFNRTYFFENAPDSVFCKKCGCCINDAYLPEELEIKNKVDISHTYDGRPIASLRFKEYIESLDFNVDFQLINSKHKFYLMIPKEILDFEADKKLNYCKNCHQYVDQAMPNPVFYAKTGQVLQEGIFSTSTSFGSGKEKSPIIILGIQTAKIIDDAIKTYKFSGADIIPIRA